MFTPIFDFSFHLTLILFGSRMSFATKHIVSHLGELHRSRDETGDFSLTCQGEVIKAHSLILGMGWAFF